MWADDNVCCTRQHDSLAPPATVRATGLGNVAAPVSSAVLGWTVRKPAQLGWIRTASRVLTARHRQGAPRPSTRIRKSLGRNTVVRTATKGQTLDCSSGHIYDAVEASANEHDSRRRQTPEAAQQGLSEGAGTQTRLGAPRPATRDPRTAG